MNFIADIIVGIIKGLTSTNAKLKMLVRIAIIATALAIIITIITEVDKGKADIFEITAASLGILGAVLGFSIKVYDDNKNKVKVERKIEDLEREVIEKPTETKTAWELARLKLESYLNRNLQQVSAIFYLTVSVMLVGFGLVVFGVYKAFTNPALMNPSIVATCAGILINLIGGTFLLIYRSTMNQAKDYVDVLERINAVGMSIQILDNISKEKSELKDTTTADIAKELLKIYGGLKSK